MQTKTQTLARFAIATPRELALRALRTLVQADARHRARRKLDSLPPERLADMGMTRRDAETAFRR